MERPSRSTAVTAGKAGTENPATAVRGVAARPPALAPVGARTRAVVDVVASPLGAARWHLAALGVRDAAVPEVAMALAVIFLA